ncbi:hypothetical protein [Hymenobacter armeniacus]|uniref:Uncharacterized protein n=1 Tax=Hymenobacter armeniacus TaxID=2771358 RepID=A0ABR8JWW7_9BACT|nr:hypothetical protein [Hymenobacter armeniacus]MBD2722214.1 hypothetical protein [Hymenobacter armeniacus]
MLPIRIEYLQSWLATLLFRFLQQFSYALYRLWQLLGGDQCSDRYFELCLPELERQNESHLRREAQKAVRAKRQTELATKSAEERAHLEQRKQKFYRMHSRPLSQRDSGIVGPVLHVNGCL